MPTENAKRTNTNYYIISKASCSFNHCLSCLSEKFSIITDANSSCATRAKNLRIHSDEAKLIIFHATRSCLCVISKIGFLLSNI